MKSSSTRLVRTTKKIILKKIIVILPSIHCDMKLVTSRFVKLKNKHFGFHRTGHAGLCDGCGCNQGSFALLLCHY